MEDETKKEQGCESVRLMNRLRVFWRVIHELERDVAAGKRPDKLEASERKRLLKTKTHDHNVSPLIPLMEALPHLHFPKGTVLDYYQDGSAFGSQPVFYVRREDEPRRPDFHVELDPDELELKTQELRQIIKPEISADGAWEMILLDELGSQFNLVWHAAYSTRRIVCDMPEFFSGNYCGCRNNCDFSVSCLTENDKAELLSWDVVPTVTFMDEKAIVKYCVFTPFGGFFKVRRMIRFKPGLRMLKPSIMAKLSYDCGIVF